MDSTITCRGNLVCLCQSICSVPKTNRHWFIVSVDQRISVGGPVVGDTHAPPVGWNLAQTVLNRQRRLLCLAALIYSDFWKWSRVAQKTHLSICAVWRRISGDTSTSKSLRWLDRVDDVFIVASQSLPTTLKINILESEVPKVRYFAIVTQKSVSSLDRETRLIQWSDSAAIPRQHFIVSIHSNVV